MRCLAFRGFVYTYYSDPGLSTVSTGSREGRDQEERVAGLFFEQALLPQGWARDIRIAIDAGRMLSVETAASPQAGDERHSIGLPGISNLHSHAFQRGM